MQASSSCHWLNQEKCYMGEGAAGSPSSHPARATDLLGFVLSLKGSLSAGTLFPTLKPVSWTAAVTSNLARSQDHLESFKNH